MFKEKSSKIAGVEEATAVTVVQALGLDLQLSGSAVAALGGLVTAFFSREETKS